MYKITLALSALLAVASAGAIGGGWGAPLVVVPGAVSTTHRVDKIVPSAVRLTSVPVLASSPVVALGGAVSSTHRVDANVPVAVVPRVANLGLGGVVLGRGLGLEGGAVVVSGNGLLGTHLVGSGLLDGAGLGWSV